MDKLLRIFLNGCIPQIQRFHVHFRQILLVTKRLYQQPSFFGRKYQVNVKNPFKTLRLSILHRSMQVFWLRQLFITVRYFLFIRLSNLKCETVSSIFFNYNKHFYVLQFFSRVKSQCSPFFITNRIFIIIFKNKSPRQTFISLKFTLGKSINNFFNPVCFNHRSVKSCYHVKIPFCGLVSF